MRHLALVLAVILLSSRAGPSLAAAPADSTHRQATIPLEIDGREVRVAVPNGMSRSDEMKAIFGSFASIPNADTRVMFLDDSVLATIRAAREGRLPEDQPMPMLLPVPFAGVGVFTGEMVQTADQARALARYEAKNPEKSLARMSSDPALRDSVRALLARDPEGVSDLPFPLPAGKKVGLEMIFLEDRASLRFWAYSRAFQTAGGPATMTLLQGLANVVLGDRTVWMMWTVHEKPTTGAAARLRRNLRGWVAATLAANP